MSTQTRSLGKEVFKSQIAKGTAVLLTFLVTILLTRWMGPDVYGAYALILGWVSLATLLISVGFPEALNKFTPILLKDGVDIVSFWGRLFLLRMGAAAILALIVRLLVAPVFTLLQHPDLIPLADFILVLFLLYQLSLFLEAFFTAQLRINVLFWANTLRQLLVLGGLVALFLGDGISLPQVLLLTIAGYGLATFIFFTAVAQTKRGGRTWRFDRLPGVLKFSLSAWAVTGITFLLSEQTDVLLLGFLTADKRQVGFYKAGTSLVWKLIGVITVSSQVVLASLAHKYSSAGEVGLTKGWQSFIKLSTLTIVPVFLFLGWHAPAIIHILYGAEYAVSAVVLRYFVLLTIVPFGLMAGGLHLMTLYVLGQERKGLSVRIVSGLLNLLLGIVLIRAFAAVGAVVATGLAALVGTFLEFYMLQRGRKRPYPWQFVGKILGAALLSALTFILLPGDTLLNLAVVGVAYGACMALLLWWWKPLTHEDYLTIRQVNHRFFAPMAWFTKM